MIYDTVVVGAGFFGSVIARLMAEYGSRVLIIEKEKYIGGFAYDYRLDKDINIHKFGPHILTVNNEKIYTFLEKFCILKRVDIKRKVYVRGKYIHLPINLKSVREMYDEKKAEKIIRKLKGFTIEKEIPLGILLDSGDPMLTEFGKQVYKDIYLGYNLKMWGKRPEQMDITVTNRLPIRLTEYSLISDAKYTVLPVFGYSRLFAEILRHPNIEIMLEKNAADFIWLDQNTRCMRWKENNQKCRVIYSGAIDELLQNKYGTLRYRALRFRYKHMDKFLDESAAVITYPNNYKKTRTTDMRMLNGVSRCGATVWVSEYPEEYSKLLNKPAYPVLDNVEKEKYKKYRKDIDRISNLYVGGRLGDYKYYTMEDTIMSAFRCYEEIISDEQI